MIKTSRRMQRALQHEKSAPRSYRPSDIEVKKEFVERSIPPDLRLISWIGRQIYQPRRIARLLFFLWGLSAAAYNQVRLFAVAFASRRVDDPEYETRQIICHRCPQFHRGYCRSCRCPRWALSRLDRKNRYSGWKCPEQKHPGVYVVYKPRKRSGCSGGK